MLIFYGNIHVCMSFLANVCVLQTTTVTHSMVLLLYDMLFMFSIHFQCRYPQTHSALHHQTKVKQDTDMH